MAQGYVDALTLQRDSVGRIHITRDINHEEAWNFHSEVFRKAGYGEDAWTLHSVFRVMPEANREIYWKQVLASAGDIKAELELAGKTYALMRIVQLQGSDEAQKIADRWLDNIESIENAQAVIDVGGTKLEQSIETLFEGMVDFIHEKFVPQPYVPQPYFPMPLPTVNPLGGSAPAPVLQPMPIPAPPARRRKKRRGGGRGGRPPTTGGGYDNGGFYRGGGGAWLTLNP
ncbi:MAG: hypothetical protein V4749_18915 [Pseudomonadota bacterium]